MTLGDLKSLPPLLTVAEAREIARVSERAMYEQLRRGDLPSTKIGRRVLVPTRPFLVALGIVEDESE
ncbi:MAG: helix-turn-helix domain-containing protein [Actinomycetota bacterium]